MTNESAYYCLLWEKFIKSQTCVTVVGFFRISTQQKIHGKNLFVKSKKRRQVDTVGIKKKQIGLDIIPLVV